MDKNRRLIRIMCRGPCCYVANVTPHVTGAMFNTELNQSGLLETNLLIRYKYIRILSSALLKYRQNGDKSQIWQHGFKQIQNS